MQNTTISLIISFINLINQKDSPKYVQYLIKISEKLSKKYNIDVPQLLSFPIIENQPPAAPFAFMSNDTLFSIILSRNSATFQFKYDSIMRSKEIANKINDLCETLLDSQSNDICGNKFQTIRLRITSNREMASYNELLNYANKLKEHYYDFGISKTGFTFACSQVNEKLPFTTEMVSYETSCNIEEKKLGIVINKDYILGGIDCSNVKFITLKKEDINNFIDYVSNVDMSDHIKETYGLSAEQ